MSVFLLLFALAVPVLAADDLPPNSDVVTQPASLAASSAGAERVTDALPPDDHVLPPSSGNGSPVDINGDTSSTYSPLPDLPPGDGIPGGDPAASTPLVDPPTSSAPVVDVPLVEELVTELPPVEVPAPDYTEPLAFLLSMVSASFGATLGSLFLKGV